MERTIIELSKDSYTLSHPNPPTIEEIKLGCLQRIATASELMAKNNQELINTLEFYKRRCNDLSKENERLRRSVASYKGKLNHEKRNNP